jgi:hypothetical protein
MKWITATGFRLLGWRTQAPYSKSNTGSNQESASILIVSSEQPQKNQYYKYALRLVSILVYSTPGVLIHTHNLNLTLD